MFYSVLLPFIEYLDPHHIEEKSALQYSAKHCENSPFTLPQCALTFSKTHVLQKKVTSSPVPELGPGGVRVISNTCNGDWFRNRAQGIGCAFPQPQNCSETTNGQCEPMDFSWLERNFLTVRRKAPRRDKFFL